MDFFSRANDYFKLNEIEYSTYNKRYVKKRKASADLLNRQGLKAKISDTKTENK